MRKRILIVVILLLGTIVAGCSSQSGRNSSSVNGYSDGRYCAKVKYYFSETGTSNTYTLLVEIENDQLVRIYWPNGGWLDHHHFRPPNIEDGSARFTSDRGADYRISIIGKEGECSLSRFAESEDDLIQEKEHDELRARHKKEDEEQAREDEEREEKERAQRDEDDRKRREEEERADEERRHRDDEDQKKKD